MSTFQRAIKVIALAVGALGLPCAARAGGITSFAIFGGNGVNITGGATVNSGLVGSNGSVSIGAFSKLFGGLAGGGDFNTPTNASSSTRVDGPTTFNGNLYFGSNATLLGAVNAGQDAFFGSSLVTNSDITVGGEFSTSFSTINGNINAGIDARLTSSFDNMTGNISANHDVDIEGTLTGNVRYGNALTTGSFTHISGSSVKSTTPVQPLAYVPKAVPPADVFTSGGAAVTNGGSALAPLAPGSYGGLGFTGFSDLYIGPGDYYFSSLAFNGKTSLHFVNLTSTNKVHLFSTGDISGTLFFPTVNGAALASAEPTVGSNVVIETLGNYTLDSDMIGSIFAPNGSITLGSFRKINGSLIAGNTVNSGSVTVNYVAPAETVYAVPEPACLSLMALMVPLLARRRKK